MVLLRALIGALFVGHGTQKLFGWFGGGGPEGTGQMFESIGLRPGRRNAIAAGASEAGGGALFASGFATPLAAASLTGVMVSAIRHVHLQKGLWSTEGGYEYNLVLLAGVFTVVAEENGLPWALGQLAAGAIGSTAMTELARREAESVEEIGRVPAEERVAAEQSGAAVSG